MLPRDQFDAVARTITCADNDTHWPILYGLVRWLKPVSAVEIGTNLGGMAIHIARAIQENLRDGQPADPLPLLTCIDDMSLNGAAGLCAFWHNLGRAGVGDHVALAMGDSRDLRHWPATVDFAFVDGDHSYEGCRNDVMQAVQRGAVCVVVHDIRDWWGPREWLEKRDAEPEWDGWDILRVPFTGGLAVCLKRAELGPLRWTRESAPKGAI